MLSGPLADYGRIWPGRRASASHLLRTNAPLIVLPKDDGMSPNAIIPICGPDRPDSRADR